MKNTFEGFLSDISVLVHIDSTVHLNDSFALRGLID